MVRASLLLALLVAAPAMAQTANPVDQLLGCRAETDAARRLACMDQAAAEIARRRESGDLRVSLKREEETRLAREFGQAERNRERVEEAAAARGEKPTLPARLKVDRVVSTVAGATKPLQLQLWTVLLADGSVWRQIDGGRGTDILKPGQKVEVKRGALGSFVMLVDGAAAMRVRRIN